MCLSMIILADFVFHQFRFDVSGACLKQVMVIFLLFGPTDQQRAQEQVLELLPMVSEVNAISEELNKHKYVQRFVDITSTGQ